MSATIDIYGLDGKKVKSVDMPDSWFAGPVRQHLIHAAVIAEEAAARHGTHSTKTRADVSGGGIKPWKQKGTGRARAGSTRSPIWRKGGVVFGPHPRDYTVKVNKQEKRAALVGALTARLSEERVIGVAVQGLESPKTATVAQFLKKGFATIRKPLFVHAAGEETLVRSVRNLRAAAYRSVGSLSARSVMLSDLVVLTDKAIQAIQSSAVATESAAKVSEEKVRAAKVSETES